MHKNIDNLILLETELKSKLPDFNKVKIIAVSKTFPTADILPLIKHGQIDFGENKVQEAIEKWSDIKNEYPNIKLHLIGRLQTNKVKFAIKIFDYIHSVDNEKLAKKISEEQSKQNKKIKIFIQVNLAEEKQKSGVSKLDLEDFYKYCKNLDLDILGLMCIPPANKDSKIFFQELSLLNQKLNLKELSMGMSSDYILATECYSTFLRIGSKIFGERIN